MGLDGFINVYPVIDSVSNKCLYFLITLLEDIGYLIWILFVAIGDLTRQNPALVVHGKVQFLPGPALFLAMLFGVPFPLATDFEARAVNDKGYGASRHTTLMRTNIHRLIAARKCRVIRAGQIQAHQTQNGLQESFGLTKRQIK